MNVRSVIQATPTHRRPTAGDYGYFARSLAAFVNIAAGRTVSISPVKQGYGDRSFFSLRFLFKTPWDTQLETLRQAVPLGANLARRSIERVTLKTGVTEAALSELIQAIRSSDLMGEKLSELFAGQGIEIEFINRSKPAVQILARPMTREDILGKPKFTGPEPAIGGPASLRRPKNNRFSDATLITLRESCFTFRYLFQYTGYQDLSEEQKAEVGDLKSWLEYFLNNGRQNREPAHLELEALNATIKEFHLRYLRDSLNLFNRETRG
ncbi:MAG: hypothetical protein JW782_08030 [Candidatus Saganbacteria bacterium]|nr:hypothetical protein [Candidatus Saganbacteria bacterium]